MSSFLLFVFLRLHWGVACIVSHILLVFYGFNLLLQLIIGSCEQLKFVSIVGLLASYFLDELVEPRQSGKIFITLDLLLKVFKFF